MIEQVLELFKKLDIEYELIEHPALFKASDREGININFKDSICCKNLLLKDEKNNNLFLVSLNIDKRADLKKIAQNLESNRLTFANEKELTENLGIKTGSASILNIILKPDAKVKFIVDKGLLELKKVAFHPNVNTASISFSPLAIEKILNYYGADYTIFEL